MHIYSQQAQPQFSFISAKMLWAIGLLLLGNAAASQDVCTGIDNMCVSKEPKLTVKYGSANIKCNADISQEQAADKPVLDFPSAIEGKRYILLMVDQDANCWLHFAAVVKKTGSLLKYEKDLIVYNGPTPPAGTGVHRYQFILWPWPGSDLSKLKFEISGRSGFPLNDFKKDNQLKKYVAVFQFQTENK